MSRHIKKLEEKNQTIAYGFDNIFGYFFQIFDDNPDVEEEKRMILDECSTFTGMSNGKMLELMLEHEVDENHSAAVALDLTF